MFFPKNIDGGLNLRYRRGSSISGMIGKMIISEVLNSTYKSKWRIGNDINRCTLCGRCEIICRRNALHVDRTTKAWTLNNRRCIHCLDCVMACPTKCLSQVRL